MENNKNTSSFELVDIPMDDEPEQSKEQLFKLPDRKRRTLTKEQKEKAVKNLEKARKVKIEKLQKLKANAHRMQEVQNQRKAQVMKIREKSLKQVRKLSKRPIEEEYSDEGSQDEYSGESGSESYSESEPEETLRRYNPGGRPPKGTKVRGPKGILDEPPVVSGIPLDQYDKIPKERKEKRESKKSMKKRIDEEIQARIEDSLSRVIKSKKKRSEKEYSEPEDEVKQGLLYQTGYRDTRGGNLSGEDRLEKKMKPHPVVKESLEKTMRIMNPWGCPQMIS